MARNKAARDRMRVTAAILGEIILQGDLTDQQQQQLRLCIDELTHGRLAKPLRTLNSNQAASSSVWMQCAAIGVAALKKLEDAEAAAKRQAKEDARRQWIDFLKTLAREIETSEMTPFMAYKLLSSKGVVGIPPGPPPGEVEWPQVVWQGYEQARKEWNEGFHQRQARYQDEAKEFLDNLFNRRGGLSWAEALQVLGLQTAPSSAADLKRAYRKAAMQCHPDQGGSPEQFQRLQDAMTLIQRQLEVQA